MTENQQIGARIKELRLKNNLTQQQLADKLHYKSRSTKSNAVRTFENILIFKQNILGIIKQKT